MLYCNTAIVAMTRRAGARLGAGWAGAGCAARHAGRARSAQAGVCGAPGRALQAAGRAGAGRSGRAGVWSRWWQVRGARDRRGAGAGREAGRRWARGERAAWARRLAKAVHSVHSAWFSTWFFDSVFFLSH